MSSRTVWLAAGLVLLPLLGLGGCDLFGGDYGPRQEGEPLRLTEYAAEQPASLADYARMGVIGGYGSIWLYDLGTGPDDPPRIVRSLRIPGYITSAAQVDARGYVWVATPDHSTKGPERVTYIVDPHRAVVQRVIDLPSEVRAAGDLSVYDDGVFLRSWRNGFSGGIGRVDPECAVDASRCDVELFTELGNVGIHSDPPIQRVGDDLYSSSNLNSRDRRASMDKIDVATGEIVASADMAGSYVIGLEHLFFQHRVGPGVWRLFKLDRETLEEVDSIPSSNMPLIAYQDGRLYRAELGGFRVEVSDAETLEVVDAISLPAAGEARHTFAFVAPDVLMLNGSASLDVSTGEISLDPSRDEVQMGGNPSRIRLPQGHPLAF